MKALDTCSQLAFCSVSGREPFPSSMQQEIPSFEVNKAGHGVLPDGGYVRVERNLAVLAGTSVNKRGPHKRCSDQGGSRTTEIESEKRQQKQSLKIKLILKSRGEA